MILDASNTALDTSLSTLELSTLEGLERVAQFVQLQGYPCRPYSPRALDTLRMLSQDKKEILAQQLQSIVNIVHATTEVENPSTGHPERCYIEPALAIYGLELRDENFWKSLQKDDVIEIYSSENIQLFRTFNFFKISGYSILDLLTLEWYLLWERPSFVLNALVQSVTEIMEGKITKAIQINSARHILKEIYNDDSVGFKCASVLVEPGIACPLYEKGSSHVKGFIFTLRGTVMSYGSEADNIAMI